MGINLPGVLACQGSRKGVQPLADVFYYIGNAVIEKPQQDVTAEPNSSRSTGLVGLRHFENSLARH